MCQEYDSSSSNDIGYDIKEYNTNSNRWIECNDIKAEDFDIISSRISHATEKIAAGKYQWNIIINNINATLNYIIKLLKRSKEKDTYRKLFHKHRKRNEFFVYGVEDVSRTKRLDAEREWFKKEYTRQVGEPKPQNEEILMKKATKGLILKSKCIPFERICYAPPLQHVSKLEQVNWEDTPLAIVCTCPADLCTCSSRKISILPPAKIPYKRRPTCMGLKSFCWAIRFMKYPKPAGTLIPKLVEAVKKEAEYYASPIGRKELKAKGPEFCMSGCLQYLVSSLAVDAALAAEIAKMQAKVDVGGLGMFMEGEEGAGESVSAHVCDEFSCSVATQTENDPETGELLMGDYSSVLYGSIDDSIMNDVEGMKLQISTYSYEPPDPCAFNFNKVLHVKEIKQHISKIKEMYSTISTARDSYCCNDVSCQFRGLSLIESLGSMLGKCKCKSVSSKEEDIEKDKKIEKAAGDVADEPEFVCPPLLDRIVELKGEVNDLFKKYFRRSEAPHPCRKKSFSDVIGQDVKQGTELKVTDKNKEQEMIIDAAEKNIKPEMSLKEIDKNTIQETPLQKMMKAEVELKETDKLKEAVLDVVHNNQRQETLRKATEIMEENACKTKDKDKVLEATFKETGQDIKDDIELKVKDNDVIKDAALDFIDENLAHKMEPTSGEGVVGSSNVIKKISNSKELQNDKKIKSCSCLKKAADRNKLHYHKAVECCVNKNGHDKKAISSLLDHMTFATSRSMVGGSDKSVVKSQPDFEDKLNHMHIKNTERDTIKEIHKSSVVNFMKNISSSSKSLSIKSKRSSINKLNKPLFIKTQSERNSEEFYSSGVFPMISRKVSNSGWRGWFSFLTENDKDKSNLHMLGKVESKKQAVKKYDTIVKSLDQSTSDNHSYYTDEVVQNVESLRHLNSNQSAVDDTTKNQESERVMPKHYRFYY